MNGFGDMEFSRNSLSWEIKKDSFKTGKRIDPEVGESR